MSRIPDSFIDDLLEKVDVVSIIGQRIALQSAGSEYKACCPFHDEKTPSFTVSPQKQFYHCFGCGKHGSAIGFLMEYDGLNFVDAVTELAQGVGLEVPAVSGASPEQQDRLAVFYQVLEQAADFYQQQLQNSPTAKKYLQQRGLNQDMLDKFQIGYAPDAWSELGELLTRRGVSPKLLLEAGLQVEKNGKQYDKFRHRIQFPIHDRRGRVIGFGGRAMTDRGPKYLNSPETPVFHKGRELYGLYQARQRQRPERLLVTEGYMDVIALTQYEFDGAVATLGTATTEQQARLLFQTSDKVVCCFDGDRAGRDAAWKALQNMLPHLQAGRQVSFLFLPQGSDPDDMVRQQSGAAMQKLLEQATPLSDYLFAQLENDLQLTSAEGRATLVARASPLLQRLPHGTYREVLEQTLSDKTRHQVKLSEPHAPAPRQTNRSADREPGQARYRKVEKTRLRQLAALLVQDPELAQSLNQAAREIINQQKNAQVINDLIDFCLQRPQISTVALLERWSARPASSLLAELASWSIPEDKTGRHDELSELLAGMQQRQLTEQIDTLMSAQQQAPLNDQQKQELRQLLASKRQLQLNQDSSTS